MGYRSMVTIAIPKELLKNNVSLLSDLSFFDMSETNDTYYFSTDTVKWKNGYSDVDRITNFVLNNIDKVGFIRVGEEANDVEMLGAIHYHELYVETHITKPDTKEVELENFKLLYGKV